MPKNGLNVSLNPYDDIFSTEESRQEEKREQVQQIPIAELFPFKNHPFKVSTAYFRRLLPDLDRRAVMKSSPATAANTLRSLQDWKPCPLLSEKWTMMPLSCSWWTAISSARASCPAKEPLRTK